MNPREKRIDMDFNGSLDCQLSIAGRIINSFQIIFISCVECLHSFKVFTIYTDLIYLSVWHIRFSYHLNIESNLSGSFVINSLDILSKLSKARNISIGYLSEFLNMFTLKSVTVSILPKLASGLPRSP